MAAADVKRIIKNAPYRYTWTYHNNNNAIVDPTSPAMSVAKDTGAFSAASGTVTHRDAGGVTDGSSYIDLTATEMSADLIELVATASNANQHYARLEPEPALDSGLVADAGTSPAGSVTLASTADATADFYNGAEIEIVRGTGAGQTRTITDYSTGRVATIDRDWITPPANGSVYIVKRTGVPMSSAIRTAANILEINSNSAAAVLLAALYKGGAISSAVVDATPSATAFDGGSGLSSDNDEYNGMLCVFTTGTLAGIPRRVNNYVGSAKTLEFDNAFPGTPANGDEFVLIGLVV